MFRLALVALACAVGLTAVAADTVPGELAAPISISWDNTPVAYALSSLSQARHIAIVRDRRVDPQQPLELAIDNQPLADALAAIAAHQKIGYCQLGPVAYFGPPQTTARLRTLAALRLEDVTRLSPAARRKLLLSRNWHWDRLSEPRALAEQLGREAGVELLGLDRIPHDLWPETDLPPLPWIDRLALVAAQFDLTFRLDNTGHRVELVDMPARPVLARSYLGGRDAAAVASRWTGAFPAANIEVVGTRIRVEAPLEVHESIEGRLRATPARRTTVTAGKPQYQLSVDKAALNQVVAQLSKQLGLEFRWDEAAIARKRIAMDQLVSVKISGADLDQLLAAVFAGTGLTTRRDGRAIVIQPK
jgi:hypothetical protein